MVGPELNMRDWTRVRGSGEGTRGEEEIGIWNERGAGSGTGRLDQAMGMDMVDEMALLEGGVYCSTFEHLACVFLFIVAWSQRKANCFLSSIGR